MKKLITVALILAMLLPAAAWAENDNNPVGRWTIASSYTELDLGYMFAKTDLFLFPDGTAYRVSIKKNKYDDLAIFYDNGVWLGDNKEMVIRVGDDTFKALIDDNGFMYVTKNDSTSKFIRICDSDGGI
jgi:hypothetical protein